MKIRRVVTANDKDGKSYIKWDSEIEGTEGRPGFAGFPMWATKKLPAEMTDEDPGKWEIGTTIAGGSVFRLASYGPGAAARWHKTDSVDYAMCVSGEMWMMMDKGEVHLKAGDVIVQCATMHNWENRGARCRASCCSCCSRPRAARRPAGKPTAGSTLNSQEGTFDVISRTIEINN